MGTGKFEPDFSLVLEEFVRAGVFGSLVPKVEFRSYPWTRFGLCERMAHSKRLHKIVFEVLMNEAGG